LLTNESSCSEIVIFMSGDYISLFCKWYEIMKIDIQVKILFNAILEKKKKQSNV